MPPQRLVLLVSMAAVSPPAEYYVGLDFESCKLWEIIGGARAALRWVVCKASAGGFVVDACGCGGQDEMCSSLRDDMIQYAGFRVVSCCCSLLWVLCCAVTGVVTARAHTHRQMEVDRRGGRASRRVRLVIVAWIGVAVPVAVRVRSAGFAARFHALFKPFHTELQVSGDRGDLSEMSVLARLRAACDAEFEFGEPSVAVLLSDRSDAAVAVQSAAVVGPRTARDFAEAATQTAGGGAERQWDGSVPRDTDRVAVTVGDSTVCAVCIAAAAGRSCETISAIPAPSLAPGGGSELASLRSALALREALITALRSQVRRTCAACLTALC